jgi:hypothetical protein
MKEKNESFFQLDHNTKMMTSLFALVLAIIIAGTVVLPSQVLKAQNMTSTGNATSSGNATSTGNATSSSTGNVTSTGDEVSDKVIANLAAPGYGNKYDVAVAGNTVPVNYNILQGSLVGILADPVRHSLDVAVNRST